MGAPTAYTIAALAVASLLATGCYCPMLSGRYADLDCFPACPPAATLQTTCTGEEAAPASGRCGCLCCGLGGWGKSALMQGLMGGGPAQRHPDYVSPQPRFHPVPTRPVFEPLPAYSPTVLLDPHDRK